MIIVFLLNQRDAGWRRAWLRDRFASFSRGSLAALADRNPRVAFLDGDFGDRRLLDRGDQILDFVYIHFNPTFLLSFLYQEHVFFDPVLALLQKCAPGRREKSIGQNIFLVVG